MKNNQKTKIVVDTNFVHYDLDDKLDKIFNGNLTYIKKFIEENDLSDKLTIVVPDFVIQERISQLAWDTEIKVSKILENLDKLKTLRVGVNVKELLKKDHKKIITRRAYKILKDNAIEILDTVKFDSGVLMDRSLKKKAPFTKGGDKGFKDTVIWLSILEYVKKNPNFDYIFCTNDNVFGSDSCKEEFKTFSKKNYCIQDNTTKLKEHLDEKYILKLELNKIYFEVSEEIKKRAGTITLEALSYYKNISSIRWSTASNFFSENVYSFPEEEKNKDDKDNFDFSNMKIEDISQSESNAEQFIVNLTLTLKNLNENSNLNRYRNFYSVTEDPVVRFGSDGLYHRRNDTIFLSVTLQYDKSIGFVSVLESRNKMVAF
ncbi:MAG: PIN domain-containing protein [Patescibacteria group bacterium]|nr:PIN domain-containing protein [Patescibacteria group bacterium]